MRKQLEASAGATRDSRRIDLADPGQYRFVMNRLRAAGKTAENSPYLFERIQHGKETALARAKAGAAASTTSQADWCDSVIVFDNPVSSGSVTTFPRTQPIVSCGGGASYVYADIATYNSNTSGTENLLVDFAAGEDFSGGTNYDDVEINPALPSDPARVNRTDSLVIADNAAGGSQITFNSEATSAAVTASIVLDHPVRHTWLPGGNGASIEMCQLRGQMTNDCDYAVGSVADDLFKPWVGHTGIAAVKPGSAVGSLPWEGDLNNYFAFEAPFVASDLYLPTQGTLTLNDNACRIAAVPSAEFQLIKSNNGGMCASFDGGFQQPDGRRVEFRTMSTFVAKGGTGGGEVACDYQKIEHNEDVIALVQIKASVRCGLAETLVSANYRVRQRVKFMTSCFVEGTGIRRADGSNTKVETIKIGDKVTSDLDGTVLTVVNVARGVESEPIVDLRDSKGHHLQLTSKHPVVKASGEVVFAAAIAKDDQVMTDRGIARIVSVARIPYPGQVYNLRLGTPDERAAMGSHRTTMFAGGLMVGDATMQEELARPLPRVAQLSSAWQQDYQNAVAGNPRMKHRLR
jgi:hypothetical protein